MTFQNNEIPILAKITINLSRLVKKKVESEGWKAQIHERTNDPFFCEKLVAAQLTQWAKTEKLSPKEPCKGKEQMECKHKFRVKSDLGLFSSEENRIS